MLNLSLNIKDILIVILPHESWTIYKDALLFPTRINIIKQYKFFCLGEVHLLYLDFFGN